MEEMKRSKDINVADTARWGSLGRKWRDRGYRGCIPCTVVHSVRKHVHGRKPHGQ